MPTIEIPDDLAAELEGATADAIRNELMCAARAFIEVTTLSDDAPKLQHRLTGRIMTVRAEWDDAER